MQPSELPMRSIIKEFGYSRGDIRNAMSPVRAGAGG